jgi:hypothetical protein
MSFNEIIIIALPIAVIALVWLPFESAIVKVFEMMGGGPSDNKDQTDITLKKENINDSIDSNLKKEVKIVELKKSFQKKQSIVKDNIDLESDIENGWHMIEEEFYELAYEETESGNLKKGLWAKSFSEAEGNDNKAKALYIKYRFNQIKESHKEIEQEEKQAEIDLKVTPKKAIIESKKDSNEEQIKRLKGRNIVGGKDIRIDSRIKTEQEIIESKIVTKDDIAKRQAEAYIKLNKKSNYWGPK